MSREPGGSSGRDDSRSLLRRLIEERGLTQAGFAQRAGLSKDHLSRILRGTVPFPSGRRTVLRLARALGCSPEEFPEYREGLGQTSASARLVLDRLAANRIDLDQFVARVPQYSPGYLHAILAGRSPFPTDPAALGAIAEACGASPFEFPEFVPDAASRERWLAAASLALDAPDFGVFRYLLDKIVAKGKAESGSLGDDELQVGPANAGVGGLALRGLDHEHHTAPPAV